MPYLDFECAMQYQRYKPLLNKFNNFHTEAPKYENGELTLGKIFISATASPVSEELHLWVNESGIFGFIKNPATGSYRVVATASPRLTLRLWDALTQAEVEFQKWLAED